jgi:hypothetical protein
MFQDKMVWFITNNSQIKKVLILENKNIFELTEKLDEQRICYNIVPFKKLLQILQNSGMSVKAGKIINSLFPRFCPFKFNKLSGEKT